MNISSRARCVNEGKPSRLHALRQRLAASLFENKRCVVRLALAEFLDQWAQLRKNRNDKTGAVLRLNHDAPGFQIDIGARDCASLSLS